KFGRDALKANTTGTDDTALGYQTLKNNTTGSANTATALKRSSATLLAPAIKPKGRLPFNGIISAAATSPWAPTPAVNRLTAITISTSAIAAWLVSPRQSELGIRQLTQPRL